VNTLSDFCFLSSYPQLSNYKITLDGKRAVSISDDNSLRIWNVWTGVETASFVGESEMRCCAVAPDGVTIVAGENSGRVHFLRFEDMNKTKQES
jgi:WD40 repeat protein